MHVVQPLQTCPCPQGVERAGVAEAISVTKLLRKHIAQSVVHFFGFRVNTHALCPRWRKGGGGQKFDASTMSIRHLNTFDRVSLRASSPASGRQTLSCLVN